MFRSFPIAKITSISYSVRMNPGLRIRLARIARGLTQEELGQCIHRTKTTVHHWETEKTKPTIETLKKVAQHLSVKENWLILGQGEMLEAFLEVPKSAANAAQAA
jgi:transcriptional regulator with XRE-family HTH domain